MSAAQADQIKSVLDGFSAVWEANDGAAVARFFTEDGSLINPFGERADGRAAIESMYSEYFSGMLRDTSTSFELTKVRSVEDNHAFADCRQVVSAPDGSVVLVIHNAALLRRDAGSWRFADSRPYTYASSPD